MVGDDLDAVTAIARVAFPDHYEERACFANRLGLYPGGCDVLAADARTIGYLIAYPWTIGGAPPLNVVLDAIPADAECLFLHDLALLPEARGQGLTRSVIERLVAKARAGGWPTIALVAVNDAVDFWRVHGFSVQASPALAAKLAGYGPDARYMTRML